MSRILDSINSPADLKLLTDEELASHLETIASRSAEDVIKEKRLKNAEKEAKEKGEKE